MRHFVNPHPRLFPSRLWQTHRSAEERSARWPFAICFVRPGPHSRNGSVVSFLLLQLLLLPEDKEAEADAKASSSCCCCCTKWRSDPQGASTRMRSYAC